MIGKEIDWLFAGESLQTGEFNNGAISEVSISELNIQKFQNDKTVNMKIHK